MEGQTPETKHSHRYGSREVSTSLADAQEGPHFGAQRRVSNERRGGEEALRPARDDTSKPDDSQPTTVGTSIPCKVIYSEHSPEFPYMVCLRMMGSAVPLPALALDRRQGTVILENPASSRARLAGGLDVGRRLG